MKKEYEKIVWHVKDNIVKIPRAVSGLGAGSANMSSYVHSYRDFERATEFEYLILNSLQKVVFFENLKSKKNVWDEDEHGYSLKIYKEELEKKLKEFDEWIDERKNQNWN